MLAIYGYTYLIHSWCRTSMKRQFILIFIVFILMPKMISMKPLVWNTVFSWNSLILGFQTSRYHHFERNFELDQILMSRSSRNDQNRPKTAFFNKKSIFVEVHPWPKARPKAWPKARSNQFLKNLEPIKYSLLVWNGVSY